jgi:outer membrane receptor protein involved in Fe transport
MSVKLRACGTRGSDRFATGTALALILASSAWATQSHAQSATPAAAVGEEPEVVLVTATKQTVRLERVPAALTIISGSELAARGVTSFEGLVDEVPGVSINYAFGGTSSGLLSVRGIGGADDYKPNGSPSVALHVDGIYQTSNAYLTTPFFDVERVEVLKGPQGTLYGRNTTAGVINLLTRAPRDTFEASLDLSAGSFEQIKGEAVIGGRLFGPVTGRLALYRETGGGFMDGLGAGTIAGFRPTIAGVVQAQVPAVTNPGPREDYGDKDVTSARLSLNVEFGENADLLVRAFATRDTSELQPYDRIERARDATIFNAGEDANPFVFYSNAYYARDVDAAGASATYTHRLGSDLELTVVAGAQSLDRQLAGNGDGTPYPQFQYDFIETLEQTSLEARLAQGGEGRLRWLAGVFAMQDTADFDSIWTSLSVRSVYRSDHEQERQSAAVFGQADFSVSEALTVSLGLRHTWDSADYQGINRDLNPWGISTFTTSFATTNPFSWDRSFEDDRTTAKLTVQYDANENARVYASYGNGYRAGGFDGTSIFTLEETFPFASETVQSFEAGFRWTGPRLRVALDVFTNSFKELQATTRLANDTNGRTNVGAATTSGADFSVQARLHEGPTQSLSLNVAMAGLNTEITQFNSRRIADVLTTVGDPLPGAPKLTANVALTHGWRIGGDLRLESRLSFSHHGAESNRLNADIGNTAPAYDLLNMRSELQFGDRFALYVWGNNLQDTVYFPELNGAVRLVGAPRTFGAGLRGNW